MSAAVKTDGNKRKSIRYDCMVPVEGKRGTAFDRSQTVDISRAGAGLLVRDYVAVNTKMALEIELKSDAEPVLAMGQVKWVRQLPGLDAYRLGISFTEVETDSKSRLKQYFK